MKLEVQNDDGNFLPYTNFTSLSASQSFIDFAGKFSFNATDVEGEFFSSDYPIKKGSLCRVTIEDIPVVTGYVEIIDISSSSNSHSVNISGRDTTCDIIDSTLVGSLNFSDADISMEGLINAVQIAIGLYIPPRPPFVNATPMLPVTNNIPNLTTFKKGDIESPEAGQNAFDFLQQYARKKQALLVPDGAGGIVITQSGESGLNYNMTRKREDTHNENTVLSSGVNYNDSDRFSRYVFGSQANLQNSNIDGNLDNKSIVSREVEVLDDDMSRSTRTMYIGAESSSDENELMDRAKWEANIRKARSRVYSCLVPTHTNFAGVPFWFNKLSAIKDDITGIDALMLVKSVAFSEDLDGSKETEFEFINQDAYKVIIEDTQSRKDTNNIGDPFILRDRVSIPSINNMINNAIFKNPSDAIDESS